MKKIAYLFFCVLTFSSFSLGQPLVGDLYLTSLKIDSVQMPKACEMYSSYFLSNSSSKKFNEDCSSDSEGIGFHSLLDSTVFIYVALSLFLQGDFTAFQEDFLRLIDNVLEGDASEEEFSGNATSVLFKKDMTTIEDLYLEGVPAECQIPTMELRSLMDEWMKKRKEFIESKKKEAT